ncbi:MAG TPA: nuclear transport factor 2 family protein, partial [Myxococcota bacterium]|nr:nuclear transport factor 2 family protein [Myxococcota bacterium]
LGITRVFEAPPDAVVRAWTDPALARTEGPRTDVWVRATFGFRKLDGAWILTHEHRSVPFYMDGSERAATDLEP